MKRVITTILCLILILVHPVSAYASLPRIVDNADLLTADEEMYLENKAAHLADTYQMDVVIVTVYSLEGKSSEAYADDYFDYNGYGIGSDYSGVLLLLSMEYRDWAISTCGETIYALTDYGIQDVFYSISGYLSEDRYFDAFDAYLDALDPYFAAYADSSPIDGYYEGYDGPGTYIPGTQEDIVYYDEQPRNLSWYLKKFFIALIIGVIAAGVTLLIMRGQMNTARAQRDAANYTKNGSARITRHQDMFLYSRTQRTRRQESSSGGGGGSSVHRSSSGRSHGGGHGKF